VGQGAIGIEVRMDDWQIIDLVRRLNHEASKACIFAERAFLRSLEGGCQVPIGAFSKIRDGMIELTGAVASLDGRRLIRDAFSGDIQDAQLIGENLAKILRQRGAEEILREIRAAAGS